MATVNDSLLTPLWNYLKDAANYVVGLLGKLGFIKTFFIGALAAMYEWLVSVITPLLPDVSPLTSVLNMIPDSGWYWLNLLAVPQGMKILLGAYIIKFLIRRIPLIG